MLSADKLMGFVPTKNSIRSREYVGKLGLKM
jgi:hypothetical protein